MQEFEIEKIVRSKRKTIALEVTDRATLIVKAPYYVSNKTIDEVIQKHIKWIRRRIEITRTQEKTFPKEFVSGESFLYLGKPYRLFVVYEQKESLRFDGAFRLREDQQTFARELFLQFYKKEAKRFILERVKLYSKIMGVSYKSFRITAATKRWGSCSRDGRLSFAYRLIMAPVSVIDYVVIHELCHVIEHNHSKAFWEKVKAALPDYEEQKRWLKEKGQLLNI